MSLNSDRHIVGNRVLGGARPACMEAEAGCEFAGRLCVPGNGGYSVSQKAV